MNSLTNLSSGARLSTDHLVKLLQVKQVSKVVICKLLELLLQSEPMVISDDILGEMVVEYAQLLGIPGITKDEINLGFDKGEELLIESMALGIHTISYFDENYPVMLRTLPSAPLVVNVLGDYKAHTNPTISLTGTKKPSRYGKRIAEKLAIHLAGNNIHVITGMEGGCNTAAATACSKAGGALTAVLSAGLDAATAKEHRKLTETVLTGNGCIISEHMLHSKDLTFILSQRSRLIVALGQATIIVESDIDGETMHLAYIAKSYDRQLFAFDHPEHMLNDKSRGNQLLISKGDAVPIRGIAEVPV